MNTERVNQIEADVTYIARYARADLYEQADALSKHLNRPKFFRIFSENLDDWLGKNSKANEFKWALRHFERYTNYLRRQLELSPDSTPIPKLYHDFLDELSLESL